MKLGLSYESKNVIGVPQNRGPKKTFELKRGVKEERTDSVKMINIPHGILFSDQTKQDEMGGACGTYEGQEKCIQVFDGEI